MIRPLQNPNLPQGRVTHLVVSDENEALCAALRVRNAPELFQKDAALQAYAAHLGTAIRQYADVLEREYHQQL